jgi:hypothetical protein
MHRTNSIRNFFSCEEWGSSCGGLTTIHALLNAAPIKAGVSVMVGSSGGELSGNAERNGECRGRREHNTREKNHRPQIHDTLLHQG